MIIKFQIEKEHPMTEVTAEIIPGQPTETETGFVFPIMMPTPDGKQVVVAAIECNRLEIENGRQRIEVNAAQYTDGQLGEASLLNHVLIDLKQFVPPTDENEVILAVSTIPASKTKAG